MDSWAETNPGRRSAAVAKKKRRPCSDGTIGSAVLPNEDARCVALNDVAFLQMAHRRLPACREPLLQNLRCVRLVVPDRDLLHRAESGRSVHKPTSARKWHEDVVSKLVLLDYVGWMDGR